MSFVGHVDCQRIEIGPVCPFAIIGKASAAPPATPLAAFRNLRRFAATPRSAVLTLPDGDLRAMFPPAALARSADVGASVKRRAATYLPRPAPPPGLTPDLAEATLTIREEHHASARVKIDAALAANAKNTQARFLRGVLQTDQDQVDEAVATFQALTEDFPELPEPYNNLAV